MTPKITSADRQRWLMRPDTGIRPQILFRYHNRHGYCAWVCEEWPENERIGMRHFWRTTKNSAIDAAIRAERKASKP